MDQREEIFDQDPLEQNPEDLQNSKKKSKAKALLVIAALNAMCLVGGIYAGKSYKHNEAEKRIVKNLNKNPKLFSTFKKMGLIKKTGEKVVVEQSSIYTDEDIKTLEKVKEDSPESIKNLKGVSTKNQYEPSIFSEDKVYKKLENNFPSFKNQFLNKN